MSLARRTLLSGEYQPTLPLLERLVSPGTAAFRRGAARLVKSVQDGCFGNVFLVGTCSLRAFIFAVLWYLFLPVSLSFVSPRLLSAR